MGADKSSSRNQSAPRKDPYVDLRDGDYVMLSSPLVDPIHWRRGKVLYRDLSSDEILIENADFSGRSQRVLVSLHEVRVFGTKEHVEAEQRKASQAVRTAANLASEIEDMAGDLRRKMIDLFEQVSGAALRTCGGAS